jgi:hypothetical protein
VARSGTLTINKGLPSEITVVSPNAVTISRADFLGGLTSFSAPAPVPPSLQAAIDQTVNLSTVSGLFNYTFTTIVTTNPSGVGT